MPRLAQVLGQGMSSIGEGYMKGLLLKQQGEQAKEELKQHELETQFKIKALQEESQRAQQADERENQILAIKQQEEARAAETFTGVTKPSWQPALAEAKALAEKTQAEASQAGVKSNLATVIGQGGPLNAQQQAYMGTGEKTIPEPYWVPKVLAMNLPDTMKASMMSQFNVAKGDAESQAMNFYLNSDKVPEEQKTKAIKEMFSTGGAYGAKPLTEKATPVDKTVQDVHKSFRKDTADFAKLRVKGESEPDEINALEDERHARYFAELQDAGENIPKQVALDYLHKLGKRWEARVKELDVEMNTWSNKARRAVGGGVSQEDYQTRLNEISDEYHQLILSIFGEETGTQLWGLLETETAKGEKKE